jgi:hypothetical protein
MQEGTAEEVFIDMYWHNNIQEGTAEELVFHRHDSGITICRRGQLRSFSST